MWNERLEKKKSSLLQEKLALHTGISAFDISVLEQLFIATLSIGLSFQSTIFAPFPRFCFDLVRSKQSQKICGNTNRGQVIQVLDPVQYPSAIAING